jgi:hypothetical protein
VNALTAAVFAAITAVKRGLTWYCVLLFLQEAKKPGRLPGFLLRAVSLFYQVVENFMPDIFALNYHLFKGPSYGPEGERKARFE